MSPGRVRENIPLNPNHLERISEAMRADTEDPEGTAYAAFHDHDKTTPLLPGMSVGGKTGTAEIKSGGVKDRVTWFVSFGPCENPRYAVVAMVEHVGFGGTTCAPIAQKIYQALVKRDSARKGVGDDAKLVSLTPGFSPVPAAPGVEPKVGRDVLIAPPETEVHRYRGAMRTSRPTLKAAGLLSRVNNPQSAIRN